MSQSQLVLHFHGEETFGPLFQAIRSRPSAGKQDLVANARSFPARRPVRTLPQVLKLANALGVPVLLSLSNERLFRALSDPAEKKSLSDGASRGRLLPVLTAGLSAETRVLAPFEVADELRLNLDLWRRALITPSFAIAAHAERRFAIHDADPARVLERTPRLGKDVTSLGFDLASLETAEDLEKSFTRLVEHLRGRGDVKVAPAAAAPRGAAEKFLGEVLTAGLRVPTFSASAPAAPDQFEVARDGFPLDLARAAAPDAVASRSLAPHGEALLAAGFDWSKLSVKAGRGVLLRRLARAGVRDGTPRSEQARASYLTALVLLEQIKTDPTNATGTISGETLASLGEITARTERLLADAAIERPAGSRPLSDAKRAQTNAAKLVPPIDAGSAGISRTDFIAQLETLTRAAFKVLEALQGDGSERAPIAASA